MIHFVIFLMYLRFIDQCYWLGSFSIHESKLPVGVSTTRTIGLFRLLGVQSWGSQWRYTFLVELPLERL